MTTTIMKSTLKMADYVLLAIFLFISVGIGIYYKFTGGKQKTTKEYFLGDGEMSIVTVALSLMVSLLSAITLLGMSSEMYMYGTSFIFVNLGFLIATAVMCYLFLPRLFQKDRISLYEYLHQRYGETLRLLISFSFVVQTLLYLSVALYTPSLALATITDINLETSIVILGLICTAYSSIGGMKAVLITDTIQSFVIYAAMLSVLIKGSMLMGGFGEIWRISNEGGRLLFPSFNPNLNIRYSFWSLTIGGCIQFLTSSAVSQTQIQRLLAAGSLKRSQWSMWLQWPITTILNCIVCMCGLVLYAYYARCDPVLQGRIEKYDQILPLFVIDTMGNIPGLVGLFFAGLFSAGLSTLSSGLNSIAAVIYKDFIAKFLGNRTLSERKISLMCQFISFLIGIIILGLSLAVRYLGGVFKVTQIIFGVVGGPVLGVFILGMYFPISNHIGTIVGLLFSFSLCLWVGFSGASLPEPLLPRSTDGCNATFTNASYRNIYSSSMNSSQSTESNLLMGNVVLNYLYSISSMWFSTIAVILTVTIGLIASSLTRRCSKCGNNKMLLTSLEWIQCKLLSRSVPVGTVKNDSSDKSVSSKEQHTESHRF